jgi:predicted ATPase
MGSNEDEWRLLSEQSRGESVLTLLKSQVDGSEGKLYVLDEPEAALSPNRQFALLALLDRVHKDGRSQIIMATHSPILMAHPEADLFWIDEKGLTRTELDEVEHWRAMSRFMRNRDGFLKQLFSDEDEDA